MSICRERMWDAGGDKVECGEPLPCSQHSRSIDGTRGRPTPPLPHRKNTSWPGRGEMPHGYPKDPASALGVIETALRIIESYGHGTPAEFPDPLSAIREGARILHEHARAYPTLVGALGDAAIALSRVARNEFDHEDDRIGLAHGTLEVVRAALASTREEG